MNRIGYLSVVFVVVFALIFTCLTWSTGISQQVTTSIQQQQEQEGQNLQELKLPEWDGIYLWLNDNKFVELKPLKKFTIYPVMCPFSGKPYPGLYTLYAGLFQRFNPADDFNIYPAGKVQGFFIRGKDYLECVKLYKVYKDGDLIFRNEFFRYDEKDYYTPTKRRTVGSEGVLIKIDDFGTEFGFAEKNRYILIVYKCPGSKSFKDAKFWVVGVTGIPSSASE